MPYKKISFVAPHGAARESQGGIEQGCDWKYDHQRWVRDFFT